MITPIYFRIERSKSLDSDLFIFSLIVSTRPLMAFPIGWILLSTMKGTPLLTELTTIFSSSGITATISCFRLSPTRSGKSDILLSFLFIIQITRALPIWN